ncbi:hypothetical protein [Maricaulis sp.]|uniref:hypothetical protein n=1 Tax=unclassified Maricaulis TaxID=2632371 RepID=UPI001B197E28|nr:hypothetical protein [Maricaulis sp.]MBO6798461.1 hypothetical protein [Maricaulis sp.]
MEFSFDASRFLGISIWEVSRAQHSPTKRMREMHLSNDILAITLQHRSVGAVTPFGIYSFTTMTMTSWTGGADGVD